MTSTPENRTIAGRDQQGRFAPGTSGNAGGRPKGLAVIVREKTLDGEELVDFYLRIFRGERVDGKKPGLRYRMEAGTWLSDRGFGKAVQRKDVDLHPDDHSDYFERLSDVELDAIIEGLTAKRDGEEPQLVIEGEARELDDAPIDQRSRTAS